MLVDVTGPIAEHGIDSDCASPWTTRGSLFRSVGRRTVAVPIVV